MDIRPGVILDGPDGAVITVDSLLGRGGFGQVFDGHLPDGTRVAIKTVLTSSLDANELRALQNEARLSKGIVHPNVVRVIHVNDGEDVSGRSPYLVMEFVEGGTLRSVIDAHRSVGSEPSTDELRAMYLQIAEGMRAVNAKVVHRDLKPENVLVDENTHQLKIADFGLAKLADTATRSETFKGWGHVLTKLLRRLSTSPIPWQWTSILPVSRFSNLRRSPGRYSQRLETILL